MQLVKPLYGHCKSENLWDKTLDEHYISDLEMKSLPADSGRYYDLKDDNPMGLSRSYVADVICAGTKKLEKYQLTQVSLKF